MIFCYFPKPLVNPAIILDLAEGSGKGPCLRKHLSVDECDKIVKGRKRLEEKFGVEA